MPSIASILAEFDKALVTATPQDYPVLLGELERIKALLWSKLARAHLDGSQQSPNKESDRPLTVAEVAARLGMRKGRIYEMTRQGQLDCLRFGKNVLVEPSALKALIERSRYQGLDKELYQRYSSTRDEKGRTQKTSSATRHDTGQPRRKTRRSPQHGSSMGEVRTEHKRACGPTDSHASPEDP